MAILKTKTFSTRDADIMFLNLVVQEAGGPGMIGRPLSQCYREVGMRSIVRQTFFLSREADQKEIEQVIAETYGRSRPVTSYVFQPLAEGHTLSVELWAFSPEAIVRQQERVTSACTGTATWGFVGGLQTGEDEAPCEGVHRMLREAQREFTRIGLDFRQVVRTWYYIGNILGIEEGEHRYSRVNRARNEFYHDKWPDLCHTPASTGIGMNTNRVALEGLALSAQEDASQVIWVDNPLQTSPYLYDSRADHQASPSFSRASAVRVGDSVILFISGTASIRGSHDVFRGDPEAQTKVTIENIAALIRADNLVGNYGLSRGATLEDLQQFRVYVKRPSDLNAIRDCCRRHLPEVPHTYLLADICRPECLVEIEGVVAFRDGGGNGGR